MPYCIFEIIWVYIQAAKQGRRLTKQAMAELTGIQVHTIGWRARQGAKLGLLVLHFRDMEGTWLELTPYGEQLFRKVMNREAEVIINKTTVVSQTASLPKVLYRILPYRQYVKAVQAIAAHARAASHPDAGADQVAPGASTT